ncbi:MAG: DUF1189 family protein [Candidatus Aenigmarchaeota archaeon]|nr:DUF1189 family protein [Candidatus Aenigmarchaeota archaeon]
MKIIKEVFDALNPLKFKELSDKPWWDAVSHFSKILLVAVVVMSLILVPDLFRLSAYFDEQLAKFDALSVTGNLSVKEPVYIPARKTQVIVDTTGMHSHLGSERFLITNDGLFYRWFNHERTITAQEFGRLLENKEKTSMLLTAIAIFLVPSALFFLYAFLWVKYMLTIFLFGTLAYFLLDLTHFRLEWRKMLNIAGYSAAPVILFEVISLPVNTDYLIPLVQIIGMNIYLVPLLLYAVIIGVATMAVHVAK